MTEVNITPALPNPYQPSVDQDRAAVAAVRAPNRARDAVDQPQRREQPSRVVAQSERKRLVAQAEALLDRQIGASAHVNRALASYAQVAEVGERSGLHDLLGFDAYA